MQRVLITGASGLIGTALLASLESPGTQVVRLVRGRAQNAAQVSWDPLAAVAPAMVSGLDAVVHLAGESVVGRWTEEKKKAIRESRVLGTRNLATALARAESKPKVLVCASAVGFYGNRGEEVLREESETGQGFLPEVCREWEDASGIAAEAGIRTVNIRIGLVLSAKGGALGKMLTPFKLGLGGRIGAGRQWWSWIHVDDIVGGIRHAMRTESLCWAGEFCGAESGAQCGVYQGIGVGAPAPGIFSGAGVCVAAGFREASGGGNVACQPARSAGEARG